MSFVDKIQTSTASFHYDEDIFIVTFKDDADIGIKEAKENLIARKKVQKEAKVKVLAIASNMWHISKEAREFYASEAVTSLNIAMAIVSTSLTTRLIANFFMRINKPATPTKLFKTEKEALTWLNSFK